MFRWSSLHSKYITNASEGSAQFLDFPKSLFFRELHNSFCLAKENPNTAVSLLFVGFDDFSLVCEDFGPIGSSQFLSVLSGNLYRCLGESGCLTFFEGHGFALLYRHYQGDEDLKKLVAGLKYVMGQPVQIGSASTQIRYSLGSSSFQKEHQSPEEALVEACTASAESSLHHDGAFLQFSDLSKDEETWSRLQLLKDLRVAVERGEFELYYQPIVESEGFFLSGFEALLRWNHPVHGQVSPAVFIPLAEESHTILEIGSWVLREACQQAFTWQVAFPRSTPFSISVNFSMKQLAQPHFASHLRSLLQEFCLDPRCVKLELTESLLAEDIEKATASLLQLRLLGVQLSIDDFGTGYSSLSYLKNLPVNTLKIDRSFLAQERTSTSDWKIVQTITTLAHHLDLDVVVEGVEHFYQLRAIRELRCEYIQGYLFGKPLPVPETTALLQRIRGQKYCLEPTPTESQHSLQSLALDAAEHCEAVQIPYLTKSLTHNALDLEDILSLEQMRLAMQVDGRSSITELASLLQKSVEELVKEVNVMVKQGLFGLLSSDLVDSDVYTNQIEEAAFLKQTPFTGEASKPMQGAQAQVLIESHFVGARNPHEAQKSMLGSASGRMSLEHFSLYPQSSEKDFLVSSVKRPVPFTKDRSVKPLQGEQNIFSRSRSNGFPTQSERHYFTRSVSGEFSTSNKRKSYVRSVSGGFPIPNERKNFIRSISGGFPIISKQLQKGKAKEALDRIIRSRIKTSQSLQSIQQSSKEEKVKDEQEEKKKALSSNRKPSKK